MDKKLKARWVEALRSGRFKQGRMYLKDGQKYCCLGVLAQIEGCKWHHGVPTIKGKSVGAKDAPGSLLSLTFCGLSKRTQDKLAELNDRGYDGIPLGFKEIADYIEKRIKGA